MALFARSALAQGVTMEECNYWRGVRWHKVQQQKSTTIGEECAGERCKNGRAQLLAGSALVQGVKMAEHDYLRGVHWHKA
jgi:hypothetical protein